MTGTAAVPDWVCRAIACGDIERLDEDQRTKYYNAVCESLGLNPLTRPLEFIELNGKLTLYAKRDATDQLRRKYQVSIEIVDRLVQEDVYIVRARALMPDGRTDESLGAVSLVGLEGEALANALMKAETKAKRRVALSICGLGMLDETEVEALPTGVRAGVGDAGHEEIERRPTAATIFRTWDARHPHSREDLYAYAKQGFGKRVMALTADEVVEVLDWIGTHEQASTVPGAEHHAV
jgi:hypothetical protein